MNTMQRSVHPLRNEFLNSRAPKASLLDFLNWLWDPGTAPVLGSMASFSDLTETKVLDHVLGKTSFTMPTTVALALTTVVPTDASTGASITEANYTGYGRQTIAGAGWNAASAGSSTNNGAITFAACTAGTSTVIGWELCDSATTAAGNSLVWGTTTSVVISTTQTPATIASAALQVTLD